MHSSRERSFASLLEQAPPLLDACISGDIAALREVRLVSKEASRVALLGLKSYTLNLKGAATDTNVGGARLLRSTRLMKLSVFLRLSGNCRQKEGLGRAACFLCKNVECQMQY